MLVRLWLLTFQHTSNGFYLQGILFQNKVKVNGNKPQRLKCSRTIEALRVERRGLQHVSEGSLHLKRKLFIVEDRHKTAKTNQRTGRKQLLKLCFCVEPA